METGTLGQYLDQYQRVVKLTSEILGLITRGKRDPIDVANKLQTIIDMPLPGEVPLGMTPAEYRHEVKWWTDWLKRHDVVEPGLPTAIAQSMGCAWQPGFPKPLAPPAPNLCTRARHAIFWRDIKGVRILTPEEYFKGRLKHTHFECIESDLESRFSEVLGGPLREMCDIALEVFEDVKAGMKKAFQVPDVDDPWGTPEGEMVLSLEEPIETICCIRALLAARRDMHHELDPLFIFWSELGNYPLGFTDDCMLVIMCAPVAEQGHLIERA